MRELNYLKTVKQFEIVLRNLFIYLYFGPLQQFEPITEEDFYFTCYS